MLRKPELSTSPMGHLGLYKDLLMGVKGLRVKELHEANFTSNTGLGFMVNWK